MEAEKRKLIIKEIEQWRRSRLLPEHYCDFLINLYLEEDGERPKPSFMGVSAAAVSDSNWKIWLLVLALVGGISFSALNFNSFGILMQIGISIIFILLGYGWGFRQQAKTPVVTYALCGISSIFLLFIGLYLLRLHEITEASAYVGYVAFSSVIWLVTGVIGRMGIFHFCGWIGLLLTYGWLLYGKLNDPGWPTLEISWIPVSIVFIWIAWLTHHKSKQAAGVLFLVGCCVWFAPELFGLLMPVEVSAKAGQAALLGKIAAAGLMLFLQRKKWIEWVL